MSTSELEASSRKLDLKTCFLWLPGRRAYLARESFRLGQDFRQEGYMELAAANFRRVTALYRDRSPVGTKHSLAAFSLVAASYNHLGLLCLDANRSDEGVLPFDKAIEIRRELRRLFPQERENEVYLGGALCNRAHSVAESDPTAALDYYRQSLAVLRQPNQTCECSYWDEQRQSWWCEQLEALGAMLPLPWVALAPQFLDNALQGIASLPPGSRQEESSRP